jgi:hypothetical protein
VEEQGSITTGINRTYFTPGKQATLYAVSQEVWMFDHWSGDLSGTSNPIHFTIHSDMSVQAVFIKRSALSILKLGEGTISRTQSLSAYPANSRVTLTATPEKDWRFVRWMGDVEPPTKTTAVTLSMDRARTITAVFEEEASGTIVISNTDDDMDKYPTEDIPAENTAPVGSVPTDLLPSCTFPSAILVLALLAGFIGFRFDSRR